MANKPKVSTGHMNHKTMKNNLPLIILLSLNIISTIIPYLPEDCRIIIIILYNNQL